MEKFIFSVADPFQMPVVTSEGIKAIQVRWPSDEQWSQRRAATRIIETSLGRGNVVNETIPSAELDQRIYESIQVNGAPPLDNEEVARLLERLSHTEIHSVEIEGTTATVVMGVCTGETKHVMKLPTAKQTKAMGLAMLKRRNLPNNRTELRFLLDASAQLYDECGGKSENYADDIIPAPHKDAAMRALTEEIAQRLLPKEPGDF